MYKNITRILFFANVCLGAAEIQVSKSHIKSSLLDVVTTIKPVRAFILGYLDSWEQVGHIEAEIFAPDEGTEGGRQWRITALAFSPRHNHLAAHVTMGGWGFIYIFDRASRQLIQMIPVQIGAMHYSPDGKYLIAPTSELYKSHTLRTFINNVIKIFETDRYSCVKELQGHTDCMCSAIFSPDGTKIISTSMDRTMRMWDVASGSCLNVIPGKFYDVIYSNCGNYIATCEDKYPAKKYKIRQASNFQEKTELEFDEPVVFSPNGAYVTSHRYLYETKNFKPIARFNGWGGPYAFTADSRFLITAGEAGNIDIITIARCIGDNAIGKLVNTSHIDCCNCAETSSRASDYLVQCPLYKNRGYADAVASSADGWIAAATRFNSPGPFDITLLRNQALEIMHADTQAGTAAQVPGIDSCGGDRKNGETAAHQAARAADKHAQKISEKKFTKVPKEKCVIL